MSECRDEIDDLLAELARLDIRLAVNNGSLGYDAPPGAFTDALKGRVREAKTALIRRLSPEPVAAEPAGEGTYPASPGQEGQWLARRDVPDTGSYLLVYSLPLDAHAEPELVRAALERIVRRHTPLRTVFAETDGTLTQTVRSPGPVAFDTVKVEEAEAIAAVRRRGLDEMARPFDLTREPGCRFVLFQTGHRRGLLLAVIDHIVFDGWSIGILKRELLAMLPALAAGREPRLRALPLAFHEWATRRRAALDGAEGEASRRFWESRAAALEAGGLPVDRARDPLAPTQGLRTLLRVSADAAAALDQLARMGRTTLTVAWTTAVGALMTRLKGEGRGASVGIPFAGRGDDNAEDLIGYFVNALPVAVPGGLDRSFAELLAAVRDEVMAALPHQDYPLARLAEDVRRQGGVEAALFDAVAVLEEIPPVQEGGAGDDRAATLGASKFDLQFILARDGEGSALLTIEHDRTLFSPDTARRLALRLQTLLVEGAARPEAPLGDLRWFPEEEHREVVETFNRTASPYPSGRSLDELFADAARRFADRPALTADGVTLTYAELDTRAGALAAGLQRCGVHAGGVVALAFARGTDAVIATLAVIKAGAAYLPLDKQMPVAVVRELLDAAGCRLVLADDAHGERLAELPDQVAVLSPAMAAVPGGHPAPVAVTAGERAYLMFTSGSTGEAKGVAVPHRAVARLVLNTDFMTIQPGDAIPQLAPLGFDAATLEIWGPILNGGRIVVLDDDTVLDPGRLEKALTGEAITLAWIPAALFNRIADERPDAFRTLRQVMTGGETASPAHMRRVLDACPGLTLTNGYGPTENTTFTTTHTVTPADTETPAIPIGRPIANTRVFIVDERLKPLPPGVWGELLAAGDGLAIEYAGRPDKTAAAFRTVRWLGHERVYRTGDRARWRADGVLEFGGRRDGQVKIRGRRIEIEAIETVLARHPAVRNAAVAVVGEGEARTLAALVVADRMLDGEWRRHIARVLPDFMVPSVFVPVPELPFTGNGKTDRRALAVLAAEALAKGTAVTGRAPSGPAEERIARLFGVLFPGGVIDAESDFFALGGHSLLAMRLAGLIEHETGARPAIRDLFAGRTVAGIAALAAQPAADVIPAAAGPDWPLSSGQARLWMLQRLYPDAGAYNVPVALDLAGPVDPERLRRALVALAERQHALRLRLTAAPADPMGVRQTLGDAASLAPVLADVSREADPEAAAQALINAKAIHPFHLETEAPARALLVKLAAERWRLLLVVHHLAFDGWSVPVLVRDLAALHDGAILPPPVRQYEDFAAWQRGFLGGDEGKALMNRWVDRLTPLPEPLALPTDRPRPAVRTMRGAYRDRRFAPATTCKLEALAEAAGATPFMALLALVDVLLHRHTGQTDFAIGTLVAGRDRAALDGLIGFFVNTLVLRRRVDPEAEFGAALTDARAACLDAMADQDCPFEALVEALKVPRDTSRNPLFDVLVVWQDDRPALPNLGAATMTLGETAFPYAKFDLGFYFWRENGAIRVQAEFDSDLFDAETVESLLARLEWLAEQAVADPTHRVRDFDLLTEGERDLVVRRFNDTARALPARRTIPAPFLDQTARTPVAAAVLFDNGSFTYDSFARQAGGIAARLRAAGVRPGDTVAVCAKRSPKLLAAIHGTLLAGAAYAPLDPDQPDLRLDGMLEDLGRPVVLAVADDLGRFNGKALALTAADEADPVDSGNDPDAAAYVIFTSGSTGKPKGVAVEHHSVLNRILWMQDTFPIGPGDVILQKTAVTFDVSVWELFWWSWTGAAVALPPPGAEKDPVALARAVERFGATVMHFVPSQLAAFLACLEDGRIDPASLKTLRYVFASGEALDPAQAEAFDRLIHRVHGTQLHNLYGPTEATVDVTWHPCSPWTGGPVPIGKPVFNTQIHILDDRGRPLPPGVAGEIHIGGIQVARGYVNRPELTAERFIPDPFAHGGRLYRTGDIGRWRRDGAVLYQGRADHQVKVRGFRVETGEIEHALEAHAAVERAVVVPVRNAGMTELHAFVLPSADIESADLRRHLRERVPDYMVPARFFRLDRLPMTGSGKIDRKALTGVPLDGVATPAALSSADPLEDAVARVWRDVLPGAVFGPNDGFFEAGGNSLLLIRLHERFEANWPGVFTIASLFGCVSVADQARRIRDAGQAALETAPAALETSAAGPLAIIGYAVRVADVEDEEGFWRDLVAGADRVRPLPPEREAVAHALSGALGGTPPERYREAAYIDGAFDFDPRRFRMAPADAAFLDPEQRLFLDTAQRALEDAGYGGSALDGRKAGVFVGAAPSPLFREMAAQAAPERGEQVFALNVASNTATRLSYLHDWRGPALLVDTACSSALTAVHLAAQALARGECEAALAGGAKLLLAPPDADNRLTIDSSTARTRAFAEGADGTGMGEGAAVFLLKPLERAKADGDAIHAVILGSAVNQDGASSGMAAPNPAAQAELIRQAAADAGIGLDTVSYIEAHGTGTALGDPIEIDGLTRAFAGVPPGTAWIGSVKGNYGHLDAAAGALGLAKAVAVLKRRVAPPQPFFTAPNPRIDFARAPVRVPTEPAPLAQRDTPLRAGVSSFGLSGINAHAILEAAPASAPWADDGAFYVVALSAADAGTLVRYVRAAAACLRTDGTWAVASVARTLTLGRSHLACRFAAVAATRAELLTALDAFTGTGAAAVKSDGRHMSARWPTRAEGEATAAAYRTGAELTWPEDVAPPRLHLPPAPFARQTCLPPLAAPAEGGALGPAVAVPGGIVRRVPVEEADFWPAAEHRINDRPTLVGMGFLPLMFEAADGPFALSGLRWLRALEPDALVPGGATLGLRDDGTVVLEGRAKDGRWLTFAEAVRAEPAPPPAVDLAAIRTRFPAMEPAGAFVAEDGPLSVGARWDCQVETATGPGGREVLTRLRRPAGQNGRRFALDPAMLDVAASAILDRPGRIPAECAAVRVFGPLPGEVLVHAARLSADANALTADVTLIDPATGHAVVVFEGLRFVGGEAVDAPLSSPVWREMPAPKETAPTNVAVIGEGPLADRLAARLAAVGALAGCTGSTAPDAAILKATTDYLLAPAPTPDAAWNAALAVKAVMAGLRRPARLLTVSEGAFALSDVPVVPEAALLAGFTLAAAREEPMLAMRHLDLDAATGIDAVLAELALALPPAPDDPRPPVAASRGGRRFEQRLAPLPPGGAPGWPDHGVCVVTGGLGGFALALAEAASAGGKVALAILTRTGKADAGQQARLDALTARGVRFTLYAADVADRTQLTAVLERVRADLGPITAVMHTAGVPDGGFLIARQRAQFDSILAPKLAGTRNLHDLTRNDPVEAFVLFASLTGLIGAPGQTAYAAANAYLDAFAHWRRAQGLPAQAIDWCALTEVGMAARMRTPIEGFALSPADAPAAWRRILASGVAQTVLLNSDADAVETEETAPPAPAAAKGDLADAVARIWAEVLGYDHVAPDDDFYALGGDSITGMRIVNRIVRELGVPATLTTLFDAGTAAALAAALGGQAPAADAIKAGPPKAPERGSYPVGWEQLAVLRAEATGEVGVAYNLPNLITLPDGVDVARLESALSRLVERHEILRTRIHLSGDDATMTVLPPEPVRLTTRHTGSDADLAGLVRPFDVGGGPLVRFELIEGPEGKRLFLDLHHSVGDGQTIELLLADLAALYDGREGPAPERQLKDYAWWTREGEGAASLEAARAYWLKTYEGPLPVIDLPATGRRPDKPTWRAGMVEFDLPEKTVAALRATAGRLRTTPYTLVLAAWAALLHRFARTSDVVITIPVDSRDSAGFPGMPGMTVALLPLRFAVDGTAPARRLIETAQARNAEALTHRSYALDQLLGDLAVPAMPGRTPLSDVSLSYMNFDAAPEGAGGAFRLTGLPRAHAKNDLAIFVRDVPDGISVALEYFADLYEGERIERLGGAFRTLLTALVRAPDTPVSDLPLLDERETAWLARMGEGPRFAYPRGISVPALFAARAAAQPDAVAVEDGVHAWTYEELRRRAAGVAKALSQAGVAPGDFVAVHMERGAPVVAVLLGVLAAGAAYAPLDPHAPADRLALILDELRCRLVIADEAGRAALGAPGRAIVLDGADLAGRTAEILPEAEGGERPAYVMFTSGSTGRPKGVTVPHRGIVRLAYTEGPERCRADDRVLQAGPLAFDASTFEIWSALLNGARVCVAGRDTLLEPDALAEALDRFAITRLFLTTALFNRQADARPQSFAKVRCLLTGGEAASPAHVRRVIEACPGLLLANVYGPTENTTFTTSHAVSEADCGLPAIPLGRPLAHTTATIRDAAMRAVPMGVWGELMTGGDGLALGYLNRPDLTAGRFVADPDRIGVRLYRTGDLCRWRLDGTIEFGGRIDAQIKLRGFRIELEEIEQALADQPGIGQAAVALDAEAGLLLAGVVTNGAAPPGETALRRALSRRLPAYMVPARFLALTELPLTANGKLDRETLPARLAGAAALPETESAAEAPRSEDERRVAAIFAEVFGRPVADRNADFLELGGHSLLAIRIINRLAELSGNRIAMSDFFAEPTVAALAGRIPKGTGDRIPKAPPAAHYPASHAQKRLYLLSAMDRHSGAYNMAFVWRLDSTFQPDVFRAALADLVRRHETLRTGFAEENGEIVQTVAEDAPPPVAVEDLRAEPRAEALRRMRREMAAPFDLALPPLVRARALRIGDGEWLVVLVLHHIAADGWSTRILLRELGAFYAEGGRAALPALPIAYRDFAVWQNRQDWADAATYWRDQLAGAPDRIALPADRPVPETQTFRGASARRELPLDTAARLHALAARSGTTVAAIGLALFAALLYRLTRQSDLVIGMGVAGRDRSELEGLIGFFVNVLPIRLRVDEDSELKGLIADAHAAMLGALDHRDYPFDRLVRDVAPRRRSNRQPLVNVVFEYQRFADLDAGLGAPPPGLPAVPDSGDEIGRELTGLTDSATAKHDLILFFQEEEGWTGLLMEYDTDILDRATAERWIDYLVQFIQMAAAPETAEP